MCLQCNTEAVSYGEALPGFHLMLAIKTDYPSDPDMQTWKEGQFGLVECNDPTVYLTHAPLKEDESSDAFYEVGAQMDRDVLEADSAKAVYRLIEAAITKGYDPKEGGVFGFWLSDYLAKYLETAKIIE